MNHRGLKENMVSALFPLWKTLPQSRNNTLSNKIRQMARFAEGARLSPAERYWRWAGYARENEVSDLLSTASKEKFVQHDYQARKQALLNTVPDKHTINDILLTDMKVVLPNDMLTKADLMSMANSLEVRVPFLDYEVVNFAFSLPSHYKVDRHMRKRILQDAFRDVLPAELYNRPKKGFEVPLLKWFRKEMRSLITDDLLAQKKIEEQGIFNYAAIDKLKRQLFSANPGDVHARLWGLVVFQWWCRKYEVAG
jgi:asparagine synthase (glutamine-hydrolysing)